MLVSEITNTMYELESEKAKLQVDSDLSLVKRYRSFHLDPPLAIRYRAFANAGFELFTDFVFADFLVTYTPYFSQVVFHPKLFPWFVPDVTPADFAKTISSLLSAAFFPPNSTISSDSVAHLQEMVTRWQKYLDERIFSLATNINNGQKMSEFWTGPWLTGT
ncbi:hypothetical protein AZE42_13172 [Rhizopogon vesiculosus]|uniref:Sugar phosphate phosphatase n=1 Tax=Rhizopogon vesiculosus TaxID=180088 RepID=A0A1J8QJH0_9AGAM|nr:hypothetical protein AZE42_13172 [Rhizopogon vesiculosus]